MKTLQTKLIITLAMGMAVLIGWFQGDEAKQKWVYKWRMTHEEKRQIAQKRSMEKKRGIFLDDYEWSSFHED
jgi:hypothetical protein